MFWLRQYSHRQAVHRIILNIKLRWVFLFVFVCLFVRYTNPHFWTDLNQTLHTSPPWSGEGHRVCMDPQYLTLFDLFCQEPVQNPGHKLAAGPRVIATALCPWLADDTCSKSHPRQHYIRDVADDTCSKSHPRQHYIRDVADDTCSKSHPRQHYIRDVADDTCSKSHPLQHYIRDVADDTCAFVLEVPFTVFNA